MRLHKVMAAGMIGMLVLAGPAMAGQPQGGHTSIRPAGQQAGEAADGSITINFQGGTLFDYIRAIEQASPSPLNIVLSGPADQVRLEPIGLRSVDVETALQVAVAMNRTLQGPAPLYHVTMSTLAGPFSEVYQVQVNLQPRTSPRVRAAETEIFLLRDLLQAEMKPQTILSAVEAALTVDDDSPEPVLRFHEPSSLLIVRGTIPQVVTVRQVVDQLKLAAQAERRERELQHLDAELERANTELRSTKAAVLQLEQELRPLQGSGDPQSIKRMNEINAKLHAARGSGEELQRRIADLGMRRAQLSAGQSPSARLRDLELENARLRAEVAELKARTQPPAGR